MYPTPSKQAFSLVELSIVLVILGLLVGGVLSGQSLIRAAELRSVSTQYQQYVAASNSFRDKYFAIPGDMNNAQSFWGVAHATPSTCVTTAGTGTQTCNGDGNGQINEVTGSNESFRYWQHLANAGLIEGAYNGITQGSDSNSATTANVARGRIGNSLWWMRYGSPASGNFLRFGGVTANNIPLGMIFKPEEAWNIDTKLDDGKPNTGRVLTFATSYPACTDGADGTILTANYLLSSSAVACATNFINVL